MSAAKSVPARKPKLAVTTPVVASFPHEALSAAAGEIRSALTLASAVSDKTPLSAFSRTPAFRDSLLSAGLPSAGLPSAGSQVFSPLISAKISVEDARLKTPITPPVAYLDFLKGMSMQSPHVVSPLPVTTSSDTRKQSNQTSSIESPTSDRKTKSDPPTTDSENAPSSVTLATTDLSGRCNDRNNSNHQVLKHKRPAAIDTAKAAAAAAAFGQRTLSGRPSTCHPYSAPPSRENITFPTPKIFSSPSSCRAPATAMAAVSSFALSLAAPRSSFDWDAVLRNAISNRAVPTTSEPPASTVAVDCFKPSTPTLKREQTSSSSSICSASEKGKTPRHIREVTRTVTYASKVGPAPKGKRRKVDHETAVGS